LANLAAHGEEISVESLDVGVNSFLIS
jgi:hypothetical protein